MDIRQQLQALLQPSPDLDLTQGYRQGLFAQGQGITPQQARQRDLTNAIQRNQQRIQTEIDGRDRALAGASELLGYDIREQPNNNVKALTPEQRLQSFIAGSNHDPELAHDIQNMDDGYLRAKYGNAVADYAYDQRKQSFKDFQLASSYIPENQRTGSIGSGLAGGIARGLRQMGGVAEQLGIMAFNDGEEQANKLRESQNSMNEDVESIAKWQGSQYSHQHAKGQIYTQLADRLRQSKYEQIAAQTGNPELAKVEADKVAEQYHSHLNTITEELMVNGLGEQAPQILLAVLSGGTAAGIAEATALGISRVVATQAITKALPKIAQAGAMIGVGVEAGLQDGASAATDAHVGVYNYYDQAFKELQQGNSAKWNELFGSKEMQALAQQYPEASPDELIRLAANNASIQAGLESGLYTGVSAGIAAPTLSGFSAKLGQGFKPSQRVALSLSAPAVEGITEYGEERQNIIAPREAINNALGVNVYDNPKLYANDQALQAGAIGAFAGSASSISGAVSAVGAAGKKVLGKGKEYLDNKANDITQKEEQTKSEETQQVVAPLVNDINVFGTSGNEQQEAVDGVLAGKNMSNSSFGEKYRELVYAKAKSEGKEVEARDYGTTIYDMDKLALHNYKQYAQAVKEGNEEKANEYRNKVNEWIATKKELSSAMWEDINSVSTDFKTLYEENSALGQEYAKLQSDLNKGVISEEQYNEEKSKLDVRADDVDARLTNLGKIGDQFQALAESTLFNVLNSPIGEVASQGIKVNKLPLKEHLNKLGKTNRAIRSLDDVLYHSTSTIKLIEQATSSEEVTEYINSWLDGVRNFTSKDMNSAKETFKGVQTELKKIKDYLDTTPYKLDENSYLGSIIDNILSVKNVNEGKAKTYLEKFFIGKNSIIGLTRNNDMAQLLYFQNSQQRKMEAVMNAYRNAISKELVINDANPITDIVTGIGKKGNPLYLTKSDGSEKVSFSSYGQMRSYLNSLKEDYDLFSNVISKIAQNNLSMDNNLVAQEQTTTPETTQDKVDTQTQPKETKFPVTGSKESKSATSEPIQKESNTNTQPEPETQSEGNTEQSEKVSKKKSEPVQEESIVAPETKTESKAESKVIPKPKPVKEKSLIEPMIDGTGSVVGYTNTNSGKTYRTEEEALNDEEIVREKAKPAKATNTVVSKPKVTQPKIHQDPKTHINSQVKEAFEKMQKSDNLTKEDITTFGLDDDVLDNGLTQKTIDRLYAQGYDLNRNLVEDSTETVSNAIDVDTVLEALNQDYDNLSDEQEIEWVTKFIKAYNPNLTEAEVNEFLASENADEIASMILAFKGVLDKVNELLDGDNLKLNPITITGQEYNDKSYYAALKRFNAFTNVLEFDEQGNLVYSNGLRFALAKTLMEGISSNLLNGRGNHKAQTEFFRQMSDESPSVYETTLQEDEYTTVTAKNEMFIVSDTSYWDNPRSGSLVNKDENTGERIKPLSKRQNFSAQYDYGNLGRPLFSLLEDFGTDLLTNLNLKFKKDTPSNLVQNITQALGGEVLGILKANNMLATYKVEFPSKSSNNNEEGNTEDNVKLFYGTLIVNSDITKAVPKSIMRAFKARMTQLNGNSIAGSVKQDINVLDRLDQSSETHSFTNGWLGLALDIANVHKTDAFKLLQGNTQKTENFVVLGSRQNLPETFGSRTNTDPILTSTPKELQEAVKNHDKIAYEINLDNLHLFENNRQAWRLLGGWVHPTEIQKHIPAIQESLTAKNNSISRVESVIEEYVAKARKLKEDVSEVKFHFSHTVTQTQRIQFDQPISVQNDKLLREMFVAKAKQFTELNTELASQNKSMDWAITDLGTMIAPVETSITVPNHDGVRDIEFLTSKVEDLARKVAKNPNAKNTVKQYEHLSALMFGVSQALGIKIERFREANILKQLKAEFEKNAWLDKLTDTLWELHTNPETILTDEQVEYFQKARDIYGSSAPRLYSALNAYAQFKHLPNGSKLETNFYLEADGIGNGMSNLVRQFTRGFTPTYFNTLKRVGITTFDMIVKYMNSKSWNFDNLSKDDLNNLGNMLEGSANHFDPESNDNSEHLDGAILDVYETVAEFVQDRLEKGLNYLLNEDDEVNLNNEVIRLTIKNALRLNQEDSLEEVTLADLLSASKNINNEIFGNNRIIDKRNLITNQNVEYFGIGNQEFVDFWTAIKTLGALSVLDNNVKIGGSSLASIADMTLLDLANNLGNLKVEIKRNLAKLGVTPAMYGGGVGGISNQVTSDILRALQEKLDEIYVELVENKTVNETLLRQVIIAGLSLNIPMTARILDENPRPEDIIHLSETIRNNKSVANRASKGSVGKLLYEGVQNRYGEFLKNGNAAIASETAIMNKLAFDLKAQYEVAQEARNKAAWKAHAEDETKGWSETDPRNNDALSKTEERKILTSLPSLPLFATAFSNNEVLVDNLLKEGHTISKKRDITDKTGTNTSYAFTNFEYAHGSLKYPNTFAFKVVNRLRSYISGGATIFTNSVVSTESKVQVVVNTVLKKVGKATLNVFDGLDANSLWRKVVGQVANKAYNEIHLNTNLQESIFHRVNRSNLSSSLVSLNLNGNSLLLKGLNSTDFSNYRKTIFETFGERDRKGKITDISNVKLEVNVQELQFLDTLASIVGTLEIGEWSESASSLRTVFNDATTKILTSGSDTVTLDMNPAVYLKFMEGFISFKPVEYKNLDYITKSHILYNMMLETLADKAATVYAMKEIERTLLAFNVNQFGGANRGYFHNADTFFTNKELVQSFRDFLNANPELNGTDALVKFIETNEFIQSKMSQYKAKKLKELKPAYKDKNTLKNHFFRDRAFSEITTVGEALNYLENLPDDNSIQANTRKALLSFMRVEGLSELDKPVYTTADNFEKYVKPNSPLADVRAGIHNSKLIYVSENAAQREEILLHELVHSISTAAFNDYFTNNGANLKAETKEAIKQIELNAMKFAELFKHHPRVAEVLNHAATTQVEPKYYKQEIFGNSNTRIEYVAAALLLAKNTNSSDLRYTALSEFLAYGLTKDSLTNAIYYQRKAIKQKDNNADKALLKVLRTLKKFIDQIKAQIRKMFFGSYEGTKVDDSMLFDILANLRVVAYDNSKVRKPFREVNEEFYNDTDTTGSNSSHESYLKRLQGMVNTSGIVEQLNQVDYLREKNIFDLQEVHNLDNTVRGIIPKLRQEGITFTQQEVSMFNTMSALNAVIFDSNPSLRTEAEKWVNKVLEAKIENFPLNTLLQGNKFDLATVMALAMTNEQIKGALEKVGNSLGKASLIENKFNDLTVYVQASKSIKGFKNQNTLTKLAYAIASSNLDKALTEQRREEIYDEEVKRYEEGLKFARNVENISGSIPKPFAKLVVGVTSDWANSRGLLSDSTDEESTIGKLLTYYAEKYSEMKGMPTWVTQALRLVLQARTKTQYIYAMRSKFVGAIEQARETVRQVIPEVIYNYFEDSYSKEIDNIIGTSVLPINLVNVFNNTKTVDMDVLQRIIQDRTSVQKEITDTVLQLRDVANKNYPNNVNEIVNILTWQAEGLGSMMLNRSAKAVAGDVSHFILPNPNAIASLYYYKNSNFKMPKQEVNRNMDLFRDLVGKLATLHSLVQLDKKDFQDLQMLAKEHRDGLQAVLEAQASVNDLSTSEQNYDFIGTEGFVHSQQDPNISLQIVMKNSPDIQRLQALGYTQEAYLSDTNWVVMKSMINPVSRYQTGSFGSTEVTYKGTSIASLEPLHSVTADVVFDEMMRHSYQQAFYKTIEKASKIPDYYKTLKVESNIKPVISPAGYIATFSIELPTNLKKQLVTLTDTGTEALGNMMGRIMEENRVQEVNTENIRILNQKYRQASDKRNYVKIDGYAEVTGSKAQQEFAKRLNDFYWAMPYHTRQQIENEGGLWVYRNELDNVIGYRHLDISDLWTGKSTLPKPVQDLLKSVFKIFQFTGSKPANAAKVSQDVVKEIVSAGKDVVLNKSLVVGAGNIISNVIHLLNVGVPHDTLANDLREGLINAQNYVRNNKRLTELEYKLAYTSLTYNERRKMEAEVKFITDSIKNNPVMPLVEGGILSTIAGVSGYEHQFDTSKDFTYRKKLLDKVGISDTLDKLGNSKLGKALENALVLEGSSTHDFMVRALDYGDFVAKYALYKHLTRNRGFSEERAMNVIREEFINYTMNRGRYFDYANALGLTWFASYALGIQKVIYRALRRNTLSTLAIYGGGKVINDYDRLGLMGTVPNQNLFERSWDYTTSTSNVLDSFEAHWMARLLPQLF